MTTKMLTHAQDRYGPNQPVSVVHINPNIPQGFVLPPYFHHITALYIIDTLGGKGKITKGNDKYWSQ